MQLSETAILDLKKTIIKIFGNDLNYSNEELNEVGLLLLTILAEGLKLKVQQVVSSGVSRKGYSRVSDNSKEKTYKLLMEKGWLNSQATSPHWMPIKLSCER